jgi:putative nucleotidyltransferase with HDIG domain
MRVAETISNDYMAVVINKGSLLDAHILEKLQYFNFQKIRVYVDTDIEIENRSFDEVRKEYSENLQAMKSVLLDISAGKNLDMPTIAKVSDVMYDRQADFIGIISCLNQVRDADEYTYAHCLNVAFICLFIAKWFNFGEDAIKAILQAGLLHDVGKCRVSTKILNKPSALTDDEFDHMKKHTIYGYKLLEKTNEVRPSTALAALEHHEKVNGKGYPLGLKSEKIHLFGKITAVADIYDAMTANRAYHKKSSPFQVFSVLEDLVYGSLDPTIVVTFLSNLSGYYVGDRVRLSDGQVGHVVFINPRSISRPVIKTESGLLNLEKETDKNLYVSEIL